MTAGAELAARRTAAAAALADFRAFETGASVQADWAVWAGRLAAAVRSLLEMTGAVLDPVQLASLGLALADAVEYRQPTGLCADCDSHPSGLCTPTPRTWTGPTTTARWRGNWGWLLMCDCREVVDDLRAELAEVRAAFAAAVAEAETRVGRKIADYRDEVYRDWEAMSGMGFARSRSRAETDRRFAEAEAAMPLAAVVPIAAAVGAR
jgi:hypothetical protein